MAGSCATDSAKVGKLAIPLVRSNLFWASIMSGEATLAIELVKWPCQKNVSFSRSGLSAAAMR